MVPFAECIGEPIKLETEKALARTERALFECAADITEGYNVEARRHLTLIRLGPFTKQMFGVTLELELGCAHGNYFARVSCKYC